MNDLFYSIPTMVFCAVGYYISWQHYQKNNFKIALGLLLICGLLLRFYTASDFFLHTWDERYHALVAKNIIQHPFKPTLYNNPILPYDFTNWNGNHVWLHKQPLSLWCMATSMGLFGINEIALRLPSILFTTMGIWLTFYIANYFYTKKIAYLSALLFSINGLIIELTAGRVATDHVDILFLFLIQLSIFLSIVSIQKQKIGYYVLTGACIGAAILTKWLPALIVFPIWFFIALDSKKYTIKNLFAIGLLMAIVSVCVFLPWQLYINHQFPLEAKWEASFNYKHFNHVIEQREGTILYFIDKIRVNYGELIYVPLLWFFWQLYKQKMPLKLVSLAIWILVPILVFSIAKTKMQAYVLFSSPALFIVTGAFFMYLQSCILPKSVNWLRFIVLFLLIALPVRYMIERVKPFENKDRSPIWTNELKTLNKQHIKKGVLFNYPNPIEAMFYTNLTVYKELPSNVYLNKLVLKGYTVLVANLDSIPNSTKNLKGIKVLRLTTCE